MDSFIVLRNTATPSTGAPFDSVFGLPNVVSPHAMSVWSSTLTAVALPEPKVELHSLDESTVHDIAQAPDVVAVARLMPTKLIEPIAKVSAEPASQVAWGITAVKADTSNFAGDGVTVAVLDTGIDRQHASFNDPQKPITFIEQDFTGAGNGDQNGHGTHCCGTIFGRDVGGERIGIARGVQHVLVGRVLGKDGGGTSEMIFKALDWAVLQNGADVVSMSLGFDFPGMVRLREADGWPTELATSLALEAYRANLRMFDALMQMAQARAAFSEGTVILAAAGNESRRDQNPRFKIAASLPAAAQGVISVGALERHNGQLRPSSFSNIFPQVSAPGVDIRSAKLGGGVVPMSGTSMACPHVAGVACLWWEAVRRSSGAIPATASAVAARLLSTSRTDSLEAGTDSADRGSGLITAPLL